MSIFNPDDESDSNDNNDNEDYILKLKNEELNKITLEIENKTLKLNRLNEEIKIIEGQYNKIISTLNEELSKIQDDLIQKKAEFETFNIKLENSFITDKDKKIEYLEKNIKDIEKKLAQEQIENENLKKEIQILKKEKEEQMKINKENELKIISSEKFKRKLSIDLHVSEKRLEFEKNKVKELEHKNRRKKEFQENNDEKNEINNNLNEIFKSSSINSEKDEDDNNNINIINDNPIYSYECFNKDNLVLNLLEGTEKAEIEIQLRNNGNIVWNENTKLKIIEPSDIKIDDIKLNPQEPRETRYYTIQFKNLINFKIKEYTTRLVFCSDGKNYGDIILIKINILDENEFYGKKIDEFRKEYNLPYDPYSDEIILNHLIDNNFIFKSTYESFFN